ncbi:hypothetical protein D3C73_694390 [compost metagenome]
MVSDFVSDHVGLGEVARGGKALGHFLEERHVQVDLLVRGAIERPGGRGGQTAGRIHAIAEQHQGRVFVLTAGLLEYRAPGVFGVAEDRAHELRAFVIGRWCLAALVGGGRRLLVHLPGQLSEDLQRILAGDPADADDQQDRRQAQALATAEAHPTAATADIITTGIDNVVAASAFFP